MARAKSHLPEGIRIVTPMLEFFANMGKECPPTGN
jgi:hypothetical protein